jgi:putative tryptophan/tyrosine transport system substrate-binding protein
MKRRAFITLLGGAAAAGPLVARAQQPAMPAIGFLDLRSPHTTSDQLRAFRQGLKDTGYVDGENVAIEYRWAEGQFDRLPAMAAELVRSQVAVIIALSTPPALAAKAATPTIPILFGATDDPVKLGLVASLARPDSNATGVYFFVSDLAAKQLGLLRELVPAVARIGLLVNPNHANAEVVARDLTTAAAAIGVQIDVVQASDTGGIDAAFATLVENKAEGLVVATDPFFYSRRLQLATLATRHVIPAVYNAREYAEAGGLMTYGTSLKEVFRHVSAYAGRILKGEKPGDLPVQRSTRFELVINLSTARALGIEIPPTLLALADEVIE